MIVLLIILIVAAIGGVAAYVVMQYTDFSSSIGGSSSSRLSSGWTADRRGGALAERIADAPSGCLVAVIAVMAIWIIAWLVFLILGLRVLTA